MTQQEYEQKKRECWENFKFARRPLNTDKKVFDYSFDRAYAIGREKETTTQEEIVEAAREAVRKEYFCEKCAWKDNCDFCGGENTAFDCCECPADSYEDGFKAGANFALGKQERDAEKKPSLTDKEVYALESAISELESLMDGTLDEDYHKENKIVINALKRIIKKYDKK